MASRTKRPDQVNRRDGNEAAAVVGDQLEALARQGARHMLMDVLGEEVEAYSAARAVSAPRGRGVLPGLPQRHLAPTANPGQRDDRSERSPGAGHPQTHLQQWLDRRTRGVAQKRGFSSKISPGV